ncbi:hypothetical protein HC928_22350 [bacterium]|nr:hypothetical protein [bacterium]
MNRTLQESGWSKRFIALELDGQFTIIVFAPDTAFRAIAQEFAIPWHNPPKRLLDSRVNTLN